MDRDRHRAASEALVRFDESSSPSTCSTCPSTLRSAGFICSAWNDMLSGYGHVPWPRTPFPRPKVVRATGTIDFDLLPEMYYIEYMPRPKQDITACVKKAWAGALPGTPGILLPA